MSKEIDLFLQSLTSLKEKDIKKLSNFYSTYCRLIKRLDKYFNDNQDILETYKDIISGIKSKKILTPEQLVLLFTWEDLPYSDEYKGPKRSLKYKITTTFYERLTLKNSNYYADLKDEDLKYDCICGNQHSSKERHLITCEDEI